jgi:hypothetical protein
VVVVEVHVEEVLVLDEENVVFDRLEVFLQLVDLQVVEEQIVELMVF